MEEQEIWKDVVGYEGLYQVSNLGGVQSLQKIHKSIHPYIQKERIMKHYPNKDGYWMVDLSKCGQKKHFQVHRLVALAFVANPLNKPEVNHLNEVPTDNREENLNWATRLENNNYGTRKERASNSLRKHSAKFAENCRRMFSKEVEQYTLDGIMIGLFRSAREAERITSVCQSSISFCCIGKRKTAGGYVWKYKE